MSSNDKETTCLNRGFSSDAYTSDEISTINNLLTYVAEIKFIPEDLLADSPGVKFMPLLMYREEVEENV